MMKALYRTAVWITTIVLAALQASCTHADEPALGPGPDHVKVDLRLSGAAPRQVLSRAADDPMEYIDNVHVLIFEEALDGNPADENDDIVVYRTYFQYGVEQNIYLKTNSEYRIYVVANLDESSTNIGNAATFFDDVHTLGDLKGKYLVSSVRPAEQASKIVMTTNGLVTVTLPNMVGGSAVTLELFLSRIASQIICNVYNKVNSQADPKVASGVYPVSWNMVNVPRSSYLMMRPVQGDGLHDYPMTAPNEEFLQSTARMMPQADAQLYSHRHSDGNDYWYTKQTFTTYSYENRRGMVADLTDMKDRMDKAPAKATCLQLFANTTSRVLVHYLPLGKGRDTETGADEINNFDFDRSCVYTMNVYINGENDVEVDSRRQYLNQHVIFVYPDVSHIDAHYVDIPVYVSGMNGMVKLQSGTCTALQPDGTPDFTTFVAMDSYPETPENDEKRWLRLSFRNPFRVTNGVKPATNLYVTLNQGVDAHSGATPILHFRENDKQVVQAAGQDPGKRTAVIRIGYVPGATTSGGYDAAIGSESVMYSYVSQYGLVTIGNIGGYDEALARYTAPMGVESIEEYTFPYYPFGVDVPNNGPYWRYRNGLVEHNSVYDGKSSTTNHYDDFRSAYASGVPPVRPGNTITSVIADPVPAYGNVYNPAYNTNAADYCMRKNRDENGDGIISGSEIKWYLPTPAQVSQMAMWVNYLKFSFDPSPPFATYYWTTSEKDATMAYAYDFGYKDEGIFVGRVVEIDKTQRYHARCVRDMPPTGSSTGMFYVKDGHLGVDLSGTFPPAMLGNKTNSNNKNTSAANQILQRTFIISRWYVTNSTNHTGSPTFAKANATGCENYSEPGYTTGWTLPTQRELSLIYGYSGLIETAMAQGFTGTNPYHKFINNRHWGITDVGNSANLWIVDFSNGYSEAVKKTQTEGYFRCVRYLSNPL